MFDAAGEGPEFLGLSSGTILSFKSLALTVQEPMINVLMLESGAER